jgi:HD-GYP domain-containing protein (c-di-GMP phosphodiesterase class II)/CheY-like chemotaxis protein
MAFLFAKPGEQPAQPSPLPDWKLLVADDEPAVHDITRLALGGFRYAQRGLQILSAYSGEEARHIMAEQDDIALALLDVVIETDDAGLRLVDFIRKDLGNSAVRIVLRTGQPGQAPERMVIDRYDINDYKEKTELTQARLYSVVRTGIQAYQHIRTLSGHKKALEFMVMQAPKLFHLSTLHTFFNNLFDTLEALLPMLSGGFALAECSAFIAYPIDTYGEFKVYLEKGKLRGRREFAEAIIKAAVERLSHQRGGFLLPEGYVLPIQDRNDTRAIIFIEQTVEFGEYERRLLDVLAMEATITFRNIDLYDLLARERNETIDMLAIAAEYKDEATGEHVKRVKKLTRLLALELGFAEEEAEHLSRASLLHDIGKLAVADEILRKPTALSAGDMEIIKSHAVKGSVLLEGRAAFEVERVIAATHHEHYDGTGYPNGLKGEDIPLPGRIVALADVYDALIHARPYKPAWPVEHVHAFILENQGKQFDPAVVQAFFRLVDKGLVEYD